MTLVVFVPHRDGVSLVADRQDTYPDLTVQPTSKLFYYENRGVAIGSSGSTATYNDLMSEFGNSQHTSSIVKDIETIYERDLPHYADAAKRLGVSLEIELIVVSRRSGSFEVAILDNQFRYDRLSHEPLDPLRGRAIGSIDAVLWMGPQLNRTLNHITESEALMLGRAVISYASRVDKSIGAPEQFGCDSLTMRTDGTWEKKWHEPHLAAIEVLLYRSRCNT